MKPEITVTSVSELVAACAQAEDKIICVAAALQEVPALTLRPNAELRGGNKSAALHFAGEQDGLTLTTGNTVAALGLFAKDRARVIRNDPAYRSLGHLRLEDLVVRGQVALISDENGQGGHVEVRGLDILSADCRHQNQRPHGFGVHVVQGAFTLWNRAKATGSRMSAELIGLRAGRPGAPVLGGGIFVSGAAEDGAELRIGTLVTGEIHSDGRIPPGTADIISGGVFVVENARVGLVQNIGPVTTYGQNDMVLDNWGTVDRWCAEERITSLGPSGVGFVNFGTLKTLEIKDVVETFGEGSRGFNVYDGNLGTASFERIVTHANGAVGIQISKAVNSIVVRRGIETFGGIGNSLVKGVMTKLAATPLSVKPGGSAGRIEVAGGILSHHPDVAPLEILGGIGTLQVVDDCAVKPALAPAA